MSLWVCLTNSVYVSVRLIRIKIKPQTTSECDKTKRVAHEVQPSLPLLF